MPMAQAVIVETGQSTLEGLGGGSYSNFGFLPVVWGAGKLKRPYSRQADSRRTVAPAGDVAIFSIARSTSEIGPVFQFWAIPMAFISECFASGRQEILDTGFVI